MNYPYAKDVGVFWRLKDKKEWEEELARHIINNVPHIAGKFIPVEANVNLDLNFKNSNNLQIQKT
ncbi:MAG TPA: hypothetical protein PKX15_09000 [Bacteroidales bacterium]|nr:hypothetical protein [Bacteroidales bacterium]